MSKNQDEEAAYAVGISVIFWVSVIVFLLILGYLLEIGLEKTIELILQLALGLILIILAMLLFSLPGLYYIIFVVNRRQKNERSCLQET